MTSQQILLEQIRKQDKNYFLSMNLIPLGRNTFYDRIKKNLPTCSFYNIQENLKRVQVTMPYKKNGVITFLGGSGSGKSVRVKSVFGWYMLPEYFGGKFKRPAIIYDMQGDDHRLITKKNGSLGNDPFPLIYNIERPLGFPDDMVINYTPLYLKEECFFNDIFYGYTLADFDFTDWNSLRITEASLETIHELIKNNKKLAENPKQFYDEFRKLQTSNRGMETAQIKTDEKISDAEKRLLRKLLNRLVEEEVVTTKDKCVDFINHLYDGKILIFNFHEDEIFSPLYISPISRKLYKWARNNTRKYGHKWLNPILLKEEAQIILNKKDVNLEQGGNKWTTKYLKQGNKYQNLVLLVTQAISEVNKVVRNHAVKQEVILSNPIPDDLRLFSRIWNNEVVNVIKTLRLEEREFALVYGGGNYVETFKSNNSMTQIHLR